MLKFPYTGVILAGGLNTRFSGKEKAFIEIGGKTILDHIYDVFSALFDQIILVTNHPKHYLRWDALIVTDLYPIRSALTGIHAGLFFAAHPHIFVSACDTPFLNKALVKTILADIEPKADVVVPETAAGLEPLCAAYAKNRLPVIERHLDQGALKIQGIFKGARVRKIPESRLRQVDPELASFLNINTPEELARATALREKTDLSDGSEKSD